MQLLPWEERKNHGFFYSIYLNIKMALTNSIEYFTRIPSSKGLKNPLLFSWVVMMLGTTLHFIVLLAFFNEPLEESMKQFIIHQLGAPPANIEVIIKQLYIIFWILIPIFGLILLFILSGLTHLALTIITKKKIEFQLTFRIMAYSHVACFVSPIPFQIGFTIALIWYTILTINAIKMIFNISRFQALATVLIPYPVLIILLNMLLMQGR